LHKVLISFVQQFMYSHRTNFLNHVAQTIDTPMGLEIKKANGIYLYSTDGKKYIDLISGIGVSNLGHRNHKVSQAIRKQLARYLHTMVYGEHIQAPQVKLATLLAKLLPDNLDSTYFVNSGSEAIEGAMKLAKRYTGRSHLVAMKNAYHGSTHGALSMMSNEEFSSAFKPLLPNVAFAEYNNIPSLDLITDQTAAVFLETVQGEAGYLPPEPEFLKAVRQKCNETGTLMVLDEIQCGMGRTGSLFAFADYDIVPDVVCLGKAFGGGLPLAAFIASKEVMKCLTHDPILGHITTFGGHPLSCAAGLSNLTQLSTGKEICEVPEKEALFRAHLNHPSIVSVSGKGLMLAIELKSAETVQNLIEYCLKNGLMTDWFLYAEHKMRIAPPLIITNKDIKRICNIIYNGLENLKED
jgi:acetylornithine/N-succinyldiaminopimelate aminotransferase